MNSKITLWYRWVAANAIGELLGLGVYFTVGYIATDLLGEAPNLVFTLFLLIIASRVIEGTIVGMTQWWAMVPYFPGLTRPSWLVATILGVLSGWFLSSWVFSPTLVGYQAASQSTQALPLGMILLQTAGIGALTGVVLSFFQWLALRSRVHKAWIWIPASTLAWALGMPFIYAATNIIQPDVPLGQIALVLGLGFLLAGAMVGAVSGVFLVRLADQSRVE